MANISLTNDIVMKEAVRVLRPGRNHYSGGVCETRILREQ